MLLGTADHLRRRERMKYGWPQSLPDDAATRYHKHDDPYLIEQTFPVNNKKRENLVWRVSKVRFAIELRKSKPPVPVYG